MTWELEENTDNQEELKIYKYITKQSKNPKFAKTLIRFLNLYEYLKTHKFKTSEELRKNILSKGQPLFSEKEADEVFGMSVMRGGESKYPLLNNFLRQFLGWVYKWQPAVLADFTDQVTPIKERLQIFKHIRDDYELGEIYGIVLDSITKIIPMNVTVLENVANEIPGIGPVSGLIATMISSVLIVFNNMIHFAEGDDAAIIVDSFLMIPFIGTSLHSIANSTESQISNISQKRQKLIDTVKNSFGQEESILVAKYIPDLNNLDSYEIPSVESLKESTLSIAEKRGLPTSVDAVKNLGQQHIQNMAAQQFGAKRLTSSRPHKNKWGTQRKLKI